MELLEAAELDGVGSFKKIRFVTIPMITLVILFIFIIVSYRRLPGFNLGVCHDQRRAGRSTLFYVPISTRACSILQMGYVSVWLFLFIVILGSSLALFNSLSRWVHYAGE